MTHDEIMALPADQLPWQLYTAGLAPKTVQRSIHRCLIVEQERYTSTMWEEEYWRPHERWDHAAPLLERFRMNVEYLRSLEHWIVLVDGWTHYGAVPFVQIPAMICRTALSVHDATHWAQPEEAAPHGE